MCSSTAATGSSGPADRGGTSSSAAMLIRGTLIMIVSPIICESAVAAWPAPMLATSRRASSCSALRAAKSSMELLPRERLPTSTMSAGRAVPQNRRAAERARSPSAPRRICFTTMSCWPASSSTTSPARRSAISITTTCSSRRPRPRRQPHDLAQAQERQHLVAQHQHVAPVERPHARLPQLDRLAHVRHRHGVHLAGHPRQQRPHDRQRQRQPQASPSSPRPARTRMSTEPPSARTRVSTASIPTPRPDRSVTCSAVENPGRAITRNSSSSSVSSTLSHRRAPRLRALASTRVAIDPAPVVAHADRHRRPIARRR